MGAEVMIEVALEVVVGEGVKVVQANFIDFLKRYCLGKIMGTRVVIEVVVEVVVLAW